MLVMQECDCIKIVSAKRQGNSQDRRQRQPWIDHKLVQSPVRTQEGEYGGGSWGDVLIYPLRRHIYTVQEEVMCSSTLYLLIRRRVKTD